MTPILFAKELVEKTSASETIKILKKFQMSNKIKKKKADFIINNNFRELNVKRNVRIIKSKILKNERNYT